VGRMTTNGRIIIYVPGSPKGGFHGTEKIRKAACRIAERLKLEVEVIQRFDLSSVWVYFESCEGELIPIYFDYGLHRQEEEVYAKIRNMMFVLSFHPKFSDLKPIREDVIRIS